MVYLRDYNFVCVSAHMQACVHVFDEQGSEIMSIPHITHPFPKAILGYKNQAN